MSTANKQKIYALDCYLWCLQHNINFGKYVQQWLLNHNFTNMTFEEALNTYDDLEIEQLSIPL